MSSSTLVETVSINYEDFSDSFLTCGTCLCVYDGVERCPKLLACSHTVCQSCLEHIVEAQVRGNGDTAASVGSFRCPICRETITVPRGGVAAFPPSFIVNQLLDLMGRQRRDVVPKCARHSQSELMFCETCDVVFCVDCAGSSHAGSGTGSTTTTGGGASAHTVIPFSIAIKRMSEILLYKASLCMKNLDGAAENVAEEMRKLDEAGERCIETAVKAFQDVASAVDRRRDDVIATVRRVRDDKKRVLREQLDIIEAERRRVRADCDGLQSQVDVRNITAKISDLNEKLDVSATLVEPRENAFMAFEFGHNTAASDIALALARFGRVAISKTFPALCTARGPALRQPIAAHLRSTATVITVDYHGNPRTSGGDPLTAELRSTAGKAGDATINVNIIDNGDGTYAIGFTPVLTGQHQLCICIFDRPIKDSPFTIEVTDHIRPIARAGGTGTAGTLPTASVSFKQPVSVAVDPNSGDVYVLDAGNSRIVILDGSLRVKCNIAGSAGLEDRGAVGLALSRQAENACCSLVIINWRTKSITELSIGENTAQSENPVVVVRRVTSTVLVEPTAVAVTSRGEYVVADSAAGGVFVIDGNGSVLASVGSKGTGAGKFNLINAVYCTPTDEIIVCDHRLQVFSRDGRYLYEIGSSGSGSSSSSGSSAPRGTYSGICRDVSGRYLATRSEKGRSVIQVFGPDRRWLFDVDSHDDRLRRPTGLAVDADGHVYVADLGNDCVKKFPYV